MLRFKIVPVAGHAPHTHGVLIDEPGPFDTMLFVFGKIEFLGEDQNSNGRFSYDYAILRHPESKDVTTKQIEEEIAQILKKILDDSSGISEIEEREQEIVEAKAYAAQFPDSPIMKNEDGTTTEFQELLPDDEN